MPSPPAPQSCELKHLLEGHTSAVLSVAFTKNGRYLLSASQDKSLRLWNPHSGAHVKTYSGPHNHEVNDVAITEDNAKFFSCGGDKHFFAWDVATAQVTRKLVGHDRKVNALALGPREEVVLSASHDKTARLWDLRSHARGPIQVLGEAGDSVLCARIRGDEVVTGSTDGGLRRYDVRKGQLCTDQLLQPIGSVCFSADGQCVLVSTLDSSISLLETGTGHRLASYGGHVNQRFKVQSTFDPGCSWVVSGSEDGGVCFWDLAGASMAASLRDHAGPVLCALFAGESLATASADGAIRIWNAALGPAPSEAAAAEGAGAPGARGAEKAPAAPGDGGLPAAFGRPAAASERPRQRGDRGKKRRREPAA